MMQSSGRIPDPSSPGGYRPQPQQSHSIHHHNHDHDNLSPGSQEEEEYTYDAVLYDDPTMRGNTRSSSQELSPGGSSHFQKEALHYRTNFGKEGGYKPPAFMGTVNAKGVVTPATTTTIGGSRAYHGESSEELLELRQEQDARRQLTTAIEADGPPGANPHDDYDINNNDDDGNNDMPFDVLNEILRSNSEMTGYGSNSNASSPPQHQQRQGNPSSGHRGYNNSSPPSSQMHQPQPPQNTTTNYRLDWEGSSNNNAPLDELDPEIGRFTMSPPKYSDPTPYTSTTDYYVMDETTEYRAAVLLDAHIEFPSPEKQAGSDYDEYGISPPSSMTDSAAPRMEEMDEGMMMIPIPTLLGQLSPPGGAEGEDDSLFDNLEEERISAAARRGKPPLLLNSAGSGKSQQQQQPSSKNRRRVRVPSPLYRQAAEADDTSLEEAPQLQGNSPVTLQERAAAAWAVRREKNATQTAKKQKEEQVAQLQQQHQQRQQRTKHVVPLTPPPTKTGVSFGKADTIHHYVAEAEDETTYYSDGDRSLNSEYSKTLESEVEDVIKDILMIGHERNSKPGRRKFKHKKKKQQKSRQRQQLERQDNDAPRGSGGGETSSGGDNNDDTFAISQYRSHVKADNTAAPANIMSTESGTTRQQQSSSDIHKGDPNKYSSSNKQRFVVGEKRGFGGDVVELPQRSLLDLTPSDTKSEGGVSSPSESMGTNSPIKTKEPKNRVDETPRTDPLETMWGLMEGGVTAVTSALDYFAFDSPPKKNENDKTRNSKKKENKSSPSTSDKKKENNASPSDENISGGTRSSPPPPSFPTPTSKDNGNAVEQTTNPRRDDTINATYVKSSTIAESSGGRCANQIAPCLDESNQTASKNKISQVSQATGLMGLAQDFLYGPEPPPSAEASTGESESVGGTVEPTVSHSLDIEESEEEGGEEDYGVDDEGSFLEDDDEMDKPFSDNLEDDPQLLTLARSAAKAHHELKRIPYDESSPIDLYSEIKFSVAELKLPLGLVFLENSGGCVVSRVSPDGSASRSGGVEVGDQLAAINGATCVNLKVDDICRHIANSSNPKQVELVLLRYQGPIRAADAGSPIEAGSFDLPGSPIGSKSFPEVSNEPPTRTSPPQKSKKGFRWFGRGKKNAGKSK